MPSELPVFIFSKSVKGLRFCINEIIFRFEGLVVLNRAN